MSLSRSNTWVLSVLLASLTLAAVGCARSGGGAAGTGAAPTPRTAFPLTITEEGGRRVTLARPARRIVSLAPAHTESLYAIGAGQLIAAADTYSNYPPEAKGKATLNCWPAPPGEQIVALKPDLVVVLTQGDEFIRQMEALRIQVLKLFPKTFEEALEDIQLLGRVTDREAAARQVVASMRERARSTEERVRGERPVRGSC
jgi:ABC-type Fe3+-hydroxamate transport system substrate-binding protein